MACMRSGVRSPSAPPLKMRNTGPSAGVFFVYGSGGFLQGCKASMVPETGGKTRPENTCQPGLPGRRIPAPAQFTRNEKPGSSFPWVFVTSKRKSRLQGGFLQGCKASMVPEVGVEPTWSCLHWILSPARLPVSPLRHKEPHLQKCNSIPKPRPWQAVTPGENTLHKLYKRRIVILHVLVP